MANLGDRLKELLEKKGMTQKDLSIKVGCTDAAICITLRAIDSQGRAF